MKIESRGVRITDVPGVIEANIIEASEPYPVVITFEGADGPADVVWSADEFREFANAIDAMRDMLAAPPQSAAERLADMDLSRPFTSTFSSEAKAPETLYGEDWSRRAHSQRSVTGCAWPQSPCVGHVITADLSTWPDCSCESRSSLAHQPGCRRALYAHGAKP